jgi:hypothetical protein
MSERSDSSDPPVSLHGLDREIFTFYHTAAEVMEKE